MEKHLNSENTAVDIKLVQWIVFPSTEYRLG